MQKTNRNYFIIISIALLLVFAGGIGGFFIGRANKSDNSRTEYDFSRERELLARIGEYERREADRITRESDRIAAERKRFERTEIAIRAIRKSDRRSSNLLQELSKEVEILADFFRDSCDLFSNDIDNMGSK